VTSPDLRSTSLHDEHKNLSARLVPFAGWAMPIQYSGITEEHRAVRAAAGLFDVSHMGELELTGEFAGAVVDYLITNDAKKLTDGQALYTCCLNEQGTILDDLIVYRFDAQRWVIVCNASNREKISAHVRKACEHHCGFRDISDETALIALQGPRAAEILASTGADGAACGGLGSFHFRQAEIDGVMTTVARTGYTGEDGFELFCPWDDAPRVWRALLAHGKDRGLVPVGLGARDTLRLEARLSLYGNEIDETTNPIEAGLGWVVKLDKGDFVGRQAVAAVKAQGPSRKIVGFEMVGRGIARHGYALKSVEGEVIGVCTSGGPGITVGKNVGLGYLPAALAQVGTRFLVDCRGKDVEAVVVPVPFYKRGR
jgi:aminomethyltransferase